MSCEIWGVSRKGKLGSSHEDDKNMSSQKNYKLKTILITPQTIFWSNEASINWSVFQHRSVCHKK